MKQLHLTARSFHRVLKLARTIADLEAADVIKANTSPKPSGTASAAQDR